MAPSEFNAVAVQSSFEYVLQDGLEDDEKDDIIIITSYARDESDDANSNDVDDQQNFLLRTITSLPRQRLQADDADPLDDFTSTGSVEVHVRAWSLSVGAAHKVGGRTVIVSGVLFT
jgi:hypothetical protein